MAVDEFYNRALPDQPANTGVTAIRRIEHIDRGVCGRQSGLSPELSLHDRLDFLPRNIVEPVVLTKRL